MDQANDTVVNVNPSKGEGACENDSSNSPTTPSQNAKVSDEWLRLMYSEAWKQYSHEDVQGQTRMGIFLTVQTALIAVLAIITKPLLDIPPIQIGVYRLWIGIGILGLFAFLLGGFLLAIARIWKQVNRAGRIYLNLRWVSVAAIETLAQLDRVNLALFEHKWKHQTRKEQESSPPYAFDTSLDKLPIDPLGALPQIRGWAAIERTIWWIESLFLMITVLGLVLLLVTVLHAIIILVFLRFAP